MLPDGSIADVKLDLQALAALSKVAREEYGLAGAVQHGASTLPSNAFGNFPRIETAEIHLATNFQNMVFDHPRLPAELRERLRALAGRERRRRAEERRHRRAVLLQGPQEGDRAVQARLLVACRRTSARAIAADLERTFAFLFEQLNVNGTEKRHQSLRPGADAAPRGAQAGAGRGRGRPRRRGIGGRMDVASRVERSCTSSGAGDASAKWLFWGALLGAGLALLYAPRSGEETRRVLQRKLWKLRAMTEEKLDELAQQFGGGQGAARRAMDDEDEELDESGELPAGSGRGAGSPSPRGRSSSAGWPSRGRGGGLAGDLEEPLA